MGEKVSNQPLIGHVEPNLLKQKGQKIVDNEIKKKNIPCGNKNHLKKEKESHENFNAVMGKPQKVAT